MDAIQSGNLAVLIDAENAQAAAIDGVLDEVSRYGTAAVKRAYADWTSPHANGWKKMLGELAIHPIQQFSYTTGKNASDSALIIDAMDLLHTNTLDGFCLVSSDSDFTRLATRLREAGLAVYGFGEKKTPRAFVAACDKFIYTEILRNAQSPAENGASEMPPLEPVLRSAIEATGRDDGWASLSAVGSNIAKVDPAFDARNYGYSKLSALVRAQSYLATQDVAEGPHTHLEVRVKDTGG